MLAALLYASVWQTARHALLQYCSEYDVLNSIVMELDASCMAGSEKVMPEKDKNGKQINYNQEGFDQLVGMIEKLTERIILMENVI